MCVKHNSTADILCATWNASATMSHSTYVDDPSWLYGRMDIMSVRLSHLLVETPTIGVEHVSPPAWCSAKTSWPRSTKAPLSAGRKFSVVRRRRSHCVCVPFYFQKTGDIVSAQCFGREIQLFGWCLAKTGITQAGLKLRGLLHLSAQAWHCPWTAWSQDHIICNCTYKKKRSQ